MQVRSDLQMMMTQTYTCNTGRHPDSARQREITGSSSDQVDALQKVTGLLHRLTILNFDSISDQNHQTIVNVSASNGETLVQPEI